MAKISIQKTKDTRATFNNSNHQTSILKKITLYFSAHTQAFKISFRNLSLTPFATLMSMFAIGLCLSLPVGLYLVIKNVQQFSQGLNEGAAISLYVEKSTPKQIEEIIAKINAYPFVDTVTYIPPEKALQEFQQTSGLKDTLALLPDNPLPGVISVQINTNKTSKTEIVRMKESLAKLPHVSQAVFDYEWVTKLNAVIKFGKTFTQFLYLIIGLGVILMVGNTIRLALERHKDEIEVLNLIGATTAFIRRPFLYRGILYGGLGGIIAAIIINQISLALQSQVQSVENLFHGVFLLENLSFYDTVLLLAASGLLGWLGAAIAFAQQHRLLARINAD